MKPHVHAFEFAPWADARLRRISRVSGVDSVEAAFRSFLRLRVHPLATDLAAKGEEDCVVGIARHDGDDLATA